MTRAVSLNVLISYAFEFSQCFQRTSSLVGYHCLISLPSRLSYRCIIYCPSPRLTWPAAVFAIYSAFTMFISISSFRFASNKSDTVPCYCLGGNNFKCSKPTILLRISPNLQISNKVSGVCVLSRSVRETNIKMSCGVESKFRAIRRCAVILNNRMKTTIGHGLSNGHHPN